MIKLRFLLLDSANNVNDQGFSGGGPRWRRNNGLNATKNARSEIFATENRKNWNLGGSMRYNYRDADVVTVGSSQRFLQSGGFLFQFKQKPIVIRKQVSRQISVWMASRFNDQYYFPAECFL